MEASTSLFNSSLCHGNSTFLHIYIFIYVCECARARPCVCTSALFVLMLACLCVGKSLLGFNQITSEGESHLAEIHGRSHRFCGCHQWFSLLISGLWWLALASGGVPNGNNNGSLIMMVWLLIWYALARKHTHTHTHTYTPSLVSNPDSRKFFKCSN